MDDYNLPTLLFAVLNRVGGAAFFAAVKHRKQKLGMVNKVSVALEHT